jgi:hypothetical protein
MSSHYNPHQPNFVVNLPYRNKLPSAPYGPYFKTIDVLSSLKGDFPEYRTSTIEKNYVWQPHFGPDVGINIDLVDQDSILVSDAQAAQNLHPDDKKYLNYLSNEKAKGNRKATFDQQSKPWWLRNTTYLENNPFRLNNKLKDEDPKLRALELKKKLVDPSADHYSEEYVEKTFSMVDETIKRLELQNKTKKQIVSSVLIVPFIVDYSINDEEEENKASKKRLFSLVRYDEDPKVVVNLVKVDDNDDSTATGQQAKKYKVDDSIVTNVRNPLSSRDETTNQSKGLEVTLVAPMMDDNSFSRKKQQHLYKWVKDYRMETHIDPANSNFIVMINEQSGKAEFFPIASRIDMKKLNLDHSLPQDCLVIRDEEALNEPKTDEEFQ